METLGNIHAPAPWKLTGTTQILDIDRGLNAFGGSLLSPGNDMVIEIKKLDSMRKYFLILIKDIGTSESFHFSSFRRTSRIVVPTKWVLYDINASLSYGRLEAKRSVRWLRSVFAQV